MAYCPECLTEYAQGSPECIDCGVPLISGPPPADELARRDSTFEENLDLVVVRSFMGSAASLNAELARNVLESQEIPCNLMGSNSARVFPMHTVVLLQVERKNLAKAAEILESYLDNSGAELPEDPLE